MLLHLPTTPSTMDTAKALVQEGNTTTTIVLADEQTAGRGRHNRPWHTFSAPHSMAATFILRPQVGPHLPLLAALALHEALQPSTNNQLAIKWPNDLLLNGKKLAGILCENIGIPDTSHQNTKTPANASLVGIGLNITPPPTVPETFLGTFLNTPINPESLANSIQACLSPLLALYEREGWTQQLHNSYVQRCVTIGQVITTHIRWRVPQIGSDTAENTELTGLVRGLTPSGHLELVGEDGTVHVIHSGEIFDKR